MRPQGYEGVQHGPVVAWLGHDSRDLLTTLSGCERPGAVLLPLNRRFAAAELAQIVCHPGAGHLPGTPEVETLAIEVPPLFRVASRLPRSTVPPRPGRCRSCCVPKTRLQTRLARFKQPRRVQVVATMPKTAPGKVQRAELVRMLATR